MNAILAKLASRKFWLSLSLVVSGLVLMFNPSVPADVTGEDFAQAHAETSAWIDSGIIIAQQLVGGLVSVLTAWGYLRSQGHVDAVQASRK